MKLQPIIYLTDGSPQAPTAAEIEILRSQARNGNTGLTTEPGYYHGVSYTGRNADDAAAPMISILERIHADPSMVLIDHDISTSYPKGTWGLKRNQSMAITEITTVYAVVGPAPQPASAGDPYAAYTPAVDQSTQDLRAEIERKLGMR